MQPGAFLNYSFLRSSNTILHSPGELLYRRPLRPKNWPKVLLYSFQVLLSNRVNITVGRQTRRDDYSAVERGIWLWDRAWTGICLCLW